MKLTAPLLGLLLGLTAATTAAFAQETEPQPTVITAKFVKSQSVQEETHFLLTGNVRVEATALLLTCDRLEIIALRSARRLKELKDSSLGDADKFKSLIATGNVRIVQNGRIATCGRAEILPQEDRIVLTENPLIEDGGNLHAGTKITLYRGEERVEVEDARFVGPPVKDLSKQATKTPNPPAPSPAPANSKPATPPSSPAPGAPQISLPGSTAPEKKP